MAANASCVTQLLKIEKWTVASVAKQFKVDMWNIMVTIFVMLNVLENAMVKSAGAAVNILSIVTV